MRSSRVDDWAAEVREEGRRKKNGNTKTEKDINVEAVPATCCYCCRSSSDVAPSRRHRLRNSAVASAELFLPKRVRS